MPVLHGLVSLLVSTACQQLPFALSSSCAPLLHAPKPVEFGDEARGVEEERRGEQEARPRRCVEFVHHCRLAERGAPDNKYNYIARPVSE